MRKKLIIGVVAILLAGAFTFYATSRQYEEVNEWEKLTNSNEYLGNLNKVFTTEVSELNKQFEKVEDQVEDATKKVETSKQMDELYIKYQAIRKKIEAMEPYEDPADKQLTHYINEYRSCIITYLETQEAIVDEYKRYIKDRNEFSMEKIAKLNVVLLDDIEAFEKVKDDMENHFNE